MGFVLTASRVIAYGTPAPARRAITSLSDATTALIPRALISRVGFAARFNGRGNLDGARSGARYGDCKPRA